MALSTRPRLLLLDEVAAGLTESEVETMALLIRRQSEAQGSRTVKVTHQDATLRQGILDLPGTGMGQ